jgi:hypothetical protein
MGVTCGVSAVFVFEIEYSRFIDGCDVSVFPRWEETSCVWSIDPDCVFDVEEEIPTVRFKLVSVEGLVCLVFGEGEEELIEGWRLWIVVCKRSKAWKREGFDDDEEEGRVVLEDIEVEVLKDVAMLREV